MIRILYSAKRWQGKTLANLPNLEQFAKVIPIQIYIIKLQVDSAECPANSGEHAWLKLVTTKSTVGLCSITSTVYASISWITQFSFTRKLCFVIESILN